MSGWQRCGRRQLRQKRYLDSPLTPPSPRKRQIRAFSSLPRCITFTDESSRPGLWSEAEVKALVEFVLCHSSEDCWPTHQQVVFWSSAATFVKSVLLYYILLVVTNTAIYVLGFITVQCHLGAACRFKILRGLKKGLNVRSKNPAGSRVATILT